MWRSFPAGSVGTALAMWVVDDAPDVIALFQPNGTQRKQRTGACARRAVPGHSSVERGRWVRRLVHQPGTAVYFSTWSWRDVDELDWSFQEAAWERFTPETGWGLPQLPDRWATAD